ncbi:MAG: 4'-phosphopantetheinyl transferase superfamily protein [Motiliproteus sp.]
MTTGAPSSNSRKITVWVAKKDNQNNELDRITESMLSPSEKDQLECRKNINKRQEFLLSRALMRHAISKNFNLNANKLVFTEIDNYLPDIRNIPSNTYISLTHSGGMICFVISTKPIGIDLEKIRKNTNLIDKSKYFMNEMEMNIFEKTNTPELFYKLWCIKEAYFKMLPKNQQSTTNMKDIDTTALIARNKTTIIEDEIGTFHLSIVSKEKYDGIQYEYFP